MAEIAATAGRKVFCCFFSKKQALLSLLGSFLLQMTATGQRNQGIDALRGAIHDNELLLEKAYLPGMAAIATGGLAAIASRRWQPGRPWQLGLMTIGVVCWLCVILAENLVWPHLGESTMLVLTAGSALLLVGLDGSPRLRLAGLGWLRAFGRLSYEVYLTHMFVVFTALDLFHAARLPDRVGYLLYPVVLAGSLGIGVLVAHAVSQPAEAWVRFRWQARQAVLF